jgi:hypothetical protein
MSVRVMMKQALAHIAVFGAALAPQFVAAAGPFGPTAMPPADYVLAKLNTHPVVILGEAHWVRHDALLVAALVPTLAQRRVVLAMEILRARDQKAIDQLLSAPRWDPVAAMRIMRSAAWPYREYLDILHAAWDADHEAPGAIRVLALGPDPDWRATLSSGRGPTYDAFLADRIAAEVDAGNRVLVYCGIHHGFTRYVQPELDLEGRATAFIDRAGNILRRRFGERVFLITLHSPVWCGKEPWSYCLPLGGAIDCAAAPGGKPVGFDVAGTDFAGRLVDHGVYYAHGYAELRFGEMTDGYIWTRPIDAYEDVHLIPLSEFAPSATALDEVLANNPFSDDKGLSRERVEALWSQEAAKRADPLTFRGWQSLKVWRDAYCAGPTRR